MFLCLFVCGLVCLFVCEQDNSKTYGRILTKFSGYSEKVKGRNDSILGEIRIIWIFWIHEM